MKSLSTSGVIIGMAVVILIIVVLLFSLENQQEMYTLKASTITVGLSTFDVIEKRPEVFSGIPLTIQVVRFQVPPQSIDSLLKNDTQLTVIPVELAGLTMQKGDVRIIAVDNYMNQAIIVRNDSSINDIRDLKGKTVAAVVGSGTYAMFKSFMKELYNITVTEGEESDIKIINVRPSEVIDAVLNGDADAGVIWDPIVSLAVTKYNMKILASYQELWEKWSGTTKPPMLVWIVRGDILENNHKLIDLLQETHKKAAEYWNNNKEDTIAILVELYGLSSDVAEKVWERNQMYTAKCISEEMKESIVKIWELAVEAGYLEKMPSPNNIITCSDNQ